MPIALIVLGCIIFVISFFGCCGAIRESQCMVTTYAIFLLLLVVGMIVCASLVFIYKEDVLREAQRAYDTFFDNRHEPANGRALDNLQRAVGSNFIL